MDSAAKKLVQVAVSGSAVSESIVAELVQQVAKLRKGGDDPLGQPEQLLGEWVESIVSAVLAGAGWSAAPGNAWKNAAGTRSVDLYYEDDSVWVAAAEEDEALDPADWDAPLEFGFGHAFAWGGTDSFYESDLQKQDEAAVRQLVDHLPHLVRFLRPPTAFKR